MEVREKKFQRNQYLESYLQEVNGDLKNTEQYLLEKSYETYPVIFVMGALRSGTTLTTQWLANTNEFAYPTNLLSRFYEAPIVGAKIQRLLLDPQYAFRDELTDFSHEVNYRSNNGKTSGALAPNEFWYFWRRFFPYDSSGIDYLPNEELANLVDKGTFVKELMGIANVFEKPLAMKGMIANYNIEFLDQILDKVIFISVKRDPYTNIASILEARKRQLGDERKWYSFHIPEMNDLQTYDDPVIQAAGQAYYINQAVDKSLEKVSGERKMELRYEEFCGEPEKFYYILRDKLLQQGYEISDKYCGEKKFTITREVCDDRIRKGYTRFLEENIR